MLRKKYLIIPSVPTPNGRLHLGHIGGPFLSADLIARDRQRAGHIAAIICGTDIYESFVMLQAAKENRSIQAICHYYHALIALDLQAMDIDLHTFINPLAPAWHEKYCTWQHYIFNKLIEKGGVQSRREKIKWDESAKQFLAGCWLRGHCPSCAEKTESYFCEHCGAYFRPEEMQNVQGQGTTKIVSNLFMQVPMEIDRSAFKTLYKNTMQKQKGLLRLSANSAWGLPILNHQDGPTLFSYGLIHAYFLMMGEVFDNDKNAFSKHSDVTTISCFGLDNAIPFLASGFGIAHYVDDVKAFDHYLGNYFYYLDDEKFSKSKRHAIFVHDLIHDKEASSDIVRLYLASIDVRNQTGRFSRQQFLHFYQQTQAWITDITQLVNQCTYSPGEIHLSETFHQLLQIQAAALHPEQFSPHEALNTLYTWLTMKTATLKWIVGFAILVYPFMPRLAKNIWHHLGFEGPPNILGLQHAEKRPLPFFYRTKKITSEELYAQPLSY